MDAACLCRRPCSVCAAPGPSEVLGAVPFCVTCLETLASGAGEAVRIPCEPSGVCDACPAFLRGRNPVVRLWSAPLFEGRAAGLLLCPSHLNDLASHCLAPRAVRRLRRLLVKRENDPGLTLVLLCEAFYNRNGFSRGDVLQETD